MIFGLVHNSVIDLYLNILHLKDIGSVLDEYWRDNIEPPSELQTRAETAAEQFQLSETNALKLFEKPILDLQLTLLRDRCGDA